MSACSVFASSGGSRIYDVPVSMMADRPEKWHALLSTLASSRGMLHSPLRPWVFVYEIFPENLLSSTPPKVTSPSFPPSEARERLKLTMFDLRTLSLATSSMNVGTAELLLLDGANPRIPSMGYERKSFEAFEARPKLLCTFNPAMEMVSLASTPLTAPVPYPTSHVVVETFRV